MGEKRGDWECGADWVSTCADAAARKVIDSCAMAIDSYGWQSHVESCSGIKTSMKERLSNS